MGCSSSKEQPQLAETTGGIDGWAAGASSPGPIQRSQTVKHANAERRRAEAEAAQRRRLTAEGLVVPAPAPAPARRSTLEAVPEPTRASTAEADRLAAASVAAASTGPAVTPRTYGRRVDRARSSKATKASPAPAPEPTPPAPAAVTPATTVDDSGVYAFSAYVLCDFAAATDVELSVRQGDFVMVEVDESDPAPEGWCACALRRKGEAEQVGLVPWFYLVSAAHAEVSAVAAALGAADEAACASVVATPGGSTPGSTPGLAVDADTPGSPGGLVVDGADDASLGGELVEITISRGAEGALGLDVDDANRVRRIAPHGIAARQGLLRVGDLIVAIDGVAILSSGQCVELLANGAPAYRLGVRRGGWCEASETQDIMSTQRLNELGMGKIQPLHACGTPGGGLTYVSMQGRFVDSTPGVSRFLRERARPLAPPPGVLSTKRPCIDT